MHTKTLI